MGPKMCALAGADYDGAFLNWVTPAYAAGAREQVRRRRRGRSRPPPVLGYVRTAVGADAKERLAKEEGFYRDLHDGYRNHFARLGEPEGTVGVAEVVSSRSRPSSPSERRSTSSSCAASRAPPSRHDRRRRGGGT